MMPINKNAKTEAAEEIDEHFDGEETLSIEYRQELNGQEENTQTEVYPDAVVSIFPESQSAFQMLRKYQKKIPLIKLDPEFQRSSVWNIKQKSELIESILMGIPLPIIYVKEDPQGKYIIVDGRQRLTTLFDYMTHQFSLKGLTVLTELNGRFFSDNEDTIPEDKRLTQLQQSKIEDCQLSLNVIKPPTPDRVTFDLFDRVNRGGTRLNNQEMRNAIYQGESTKLLKELSEKTSFIEATEHAISPKRMKDKYLILRLVAFYLWRTDSLIDVKEPIKKTVDYKSDLEEFLSKTMLYLNDPISEVFRTIFPGMFNNAMMRCSQLWGEGCFRLPRHPNSKTRRPINMALFESSSYLMLLLMQDKTSKDDYGEIYADLLAGEFDDEEKEYIQSLTYIVDSRISINNRFEIVEKAVKEYTND